MANRDVPSVKGPGAVSERARQVRTMFDRIVPRYDMLNRLMSLGMDGRWRRAAAAAVQPQGARALDVGTGTGDLVRELRRQGAARVLGVDFSAEMLAAARAKREGTDDDEAWALAEALRLPFATGTFDCVTNAFVLRNLADLPAGLAEMSRVLAPGGRLVCLDMTPPPPGPFGAVYRLYFNHLVPPLAGLLSGDLAAYRYLPNSLKGFPEASVLSVMLEEAGLTDVVVRKMGGGAVALHTAVKPSQAD